MLLEAGVSIFIPISLVVFNCARLFMFAVCEDGLLILYYTKKGTYTVNSQQKMLPEISGTNLDYKRSNEKTRKLTTHRNLSAT